MPSRRSILRGATAVVAAGAVPMAAGAVSKAAAAPADGNSLVTGAWLRPSSTGSLGNGAAPGGRVTRSQVLARGRVWVDLRVPYSPNGLDSPWGWWYDSRTGGRYRQDCSGFVSMAWQLASNLNTNSLLGVSSEPLASLQHAQPGDVFNNTNTHVMLFVRWTDSNRTRAVVMEQWSVQGPTRQREVSLAELTQRKMKAYSYDHILDDAGQPSPSQGRLFHQYRRADGSWTGFAPLNGYDGAPAFYGHGVAITGTPDGSSQILAVGTDGNVYHNARYSSGSWTGFAPLPGYDGAPRFAASSTAIAGAPDGSAQVLAVGNDGNLYHSIRLGSGHWNAFEPLAGYDGAPRFAAAGISITTTPDGFAQVLAIGNDRNVYHNVRRSSGHWNGFEPINGYGGGGRMVASSVSIAGAPDGSAQIVAVGDDGNAYHRIRGANGSWTEFAPLAGPGGAHRFGAGDVAVTTTPDGSAQLLATGHDGNVYHDVRSASGHWQGPAPLPGYDGAPRFAARRVAIAGLPDGTAQVLATGR
ncbi:hypothetical protein [Streptomyces qinzhouensis]|uniref:PLL-like beta propeller domain-containing protein n=1 Tax=Streptomyces qinzhouensis TaxID=2599401 RepID=A0A5B8IMT8_9ACTN|nr:hypothetical protein [Streptomyces qinzhouensis]QDY79938.1 hypothetical protein FQU76_29170 [Streptomyces qinzhouensis]